MTGSENKSLSETITENLVSKNLDQLFKVFSKQRDITEISLAVSQLSNDVVIQFLDYLKDRESSPRSDFPRYYCWQKHILVHHAAMLREIPLARRKEVLAPCKAFDWNTIDKQIKTLLTNQKVWKLNLAYRDQLQKQAAEKLSSDETAVGANTFNNGVFDFDVVSYAGEEVGIASTIGASESEDNWEELSETAYGDDSDDVEMVDDSENTDVETEITVHDDTSDSNSFQEQSGTQEQWDSEDCSDS